MDILFCHYPEECRSAGRQRIRDFVKKGILSATSHGYLTLDTIGVYITLMMILGSDFDADPQLVWAQSQLDDFSRGPSDRIQALFRSTLEYLDQTVGANQGFIVRAMLRIRKHDIEQPLSSSNADLESEIAASFMRFYPEKAKFQGEDANRSLIQRAAERAAGHGITRPMGLAAYATLAFMLGIGFDNDPIYWWAGECLSETRSLGEEARIGYLVARSHEHIENSLRILGNAR